MRFICRRVFVLISVILGAPLAAQNAGPEMLSSVPTILEQIGELEGRRDPKCYATAARLEDFMFGTPLTEEARFRKAELQKRLVRMLWERASDEAAASGESTISAESIEKVTTPIVRIEPLEDGGVRLLWPPAGTDSAEISSATAQPAREHLFSKRDVEHYTSIAYGYRAILAVQQELLLESDPPRALSEEAVRTFRTWLDLTTLAALHDADQRARSLDDHEIAMEVLSEAWQGVVGREAVLVDASWESMTRVAPTDFALTRDIIEQKLASFATYNQISMPVFMRNLQVYFARFEWPDDEKVSESLKVVFNESMIAFVADVLRASSERAAQQGRPFILVQDVHETLQAFGPYEVNEYEDVIFFPDLPREERVVLEAYDTDSFRDSGLHWRYLEEAIAEVEGAVALEPDPFAAELITEGVAQFGVLVLRVAGRVAKQENAPSLNTDHLGRAFTIIQSRIDRHAKVPARPQETPRLHSASAKTPRAGTFFTDVTAASGIDFEHRSSDWLSRQIRSFLHKSETVGTLTIPPAFGGAGVAADDLDQDGDDDVLILSGLGNGLYANQGDGTFEEVTPPALNPKRSDNTFGEPRQPIIADFDNDGLPDILITYVDGWHVVLRNLGDFRFESVTERAALDGRGMVAGPATVFDVNRDGLLDLYVGYFGNYLEGVLPTLNRRNRNGTPNRLYLNEGDFRFRDITEGSGTDDSGWTQALSHTDLDGDGWQDLIVGNDFGVNAYLKNRGDGTFENVSARLGTDKPSFTMNIGFADLNADDHPDIYISNIVTMVKDEKYVLPTEETEMKFHPEKLARMRVLEANDLFLSHSTEGTLEYELSDRVGRGFASTGWSWDADFFDFDLDGDDDLYCLNGMNEYMVYSDTPYYTEVGEGLAQIALPVSEREPNVFFVNEGGKLQHAAEDSGADWVGNSRSAVYLDLEGDGDLDMIVNNFHGPALVYRNDAAVVENHWLKVKLVGNPEEKSNRDAIGARLVVTGPDGLRVWREIHGSEGYLSVHPREQHFGLGRAERIDLEIRWPNGEREVIEGLEADRRYVLEQEGDRGGDRREP